MKLYQNKEFLRKRYIVQHKTAAQIAQECSTTEMTVTRWLTKFELIRKPRRWTK